MGDDIFDQPWIAGDEEEVRGGLEVGEFDDDAIILDNPNEEMNKPRQKRKLGASQAAVAPTREKHTPKQRPVELTEEQLEHKRLKLEKLKEKKKQKSLQSDGAGGGGGGGASASGSAGGRGRQAGHTTLQVLAEPEDKQAEYFWSEYCACVGADLSMFEIQDTLPPTGVQSLGACVHACVRGVGAWRAWLCCACREYAPVGA